LSGPAEQGVTGGEAARNYLKAADRLPALRAESMDWRGMPPSVKRYPRAGAVPVPDTLTSLLRGCYGLTRYQWDAWQVFVMGGGDRSRLPASGRPLRPVPSGGGLASAEVYLTQPPMPWTCS
jgi:hypothetical protein